jgi:plastocyanin
MVNRQRFPSKPRRRLLSRVATVSLVVVLAVLSACGENGENGAGESGAGVTLKGITFRPDTLGVTAGTTVTWANEDSSAHTVTSGPVDQGAAGVTEKPDGRFDSGEFTNGKKFSFKFETPGTYPYFCALHPATMRGQITVR